MSKSGLTINLHSLARRIKGANAADVRARLADIDMKSLPNVEQAQESQREKNSLQEKGQSMLDQRQKEEQIKETITREEDQRQEVIKKEEEQRQQNIKEEDERGQRILKEQEQKKETERKEEEKRLEQFKEQNDRLTEQAKELEQAQRYIDAYRAALEREAENSKRQEAEHAARAKEGEFSNAGYRYGQALGKHYDIRDPYGSLARSSMAEYGAFLQERQNLDRQIARANDPQTRQALELRKQIEAAEYMEITSNRLATQSEVIIGRRDTPEALKERARAAAFHEEAQTLRKEYRELHISRTQGERGSTGLEKAGGQQRDVSSGLDSSRPQPKQQSFERGKETKNNHLPEKEPAPALMVEDRTAGKPRGEQQKLSDYVKSLPEKTAPREFTKEQIRNDPAAKREHYSQLRDEQNRKAALDHIRQDLQGNKKLNAKDIRNLSGDDLKNIKTKGDDHLKTLVQQHERQRDQGRER